MRRLALALFLTACATAAQAQMVTVVTTVTANNLVAKTTGGNLVGAYATGPAAQAGFLMVFPLAAVPADGAVTPQDCVPMANGLASVTYGPQGPPAPYNNGIVVVLSSGANCFTKTTGSITAFIHAVIQ